MRYLTLVAGILFGLMPLPSLAADDFNGGMLPGLQLSYHFGGSGRGEREMFLVESSLRPVHSAFAAQRAQAFEAGGKATTAGNLFRFGFSPRSVTQATVLGSKFAIPDPPPSGYVIVGDTASLPAINSLLQSIGDAPARDFLQACCDDDKCLPVARPDVTWVDHKEDCDSLLEAVRSAAFDAGDHFGWVACNTRTTRSVAKALREDFGIPKKSIKAQAYWMA